MRVLTRGSEFYLVLAALMMIGVAGGCAKKPLTLNPPKVQAASGDFSAGDAVAAPQAGSGSETASASASAPAAKSEAPEATAESGTAVTDEPFLPSIDEETFSETGSSFPKGSFQPGENYLSGGIPPGVGGSPGAGDGSGGSFRAGENSLSGGGAGAGGGSGAGSRPNGSFQPGENYLSGGIPGTGGTPGVSGRPGGGSGRGEFNEFAGGGPTTGEGSRAGGLGALAPGLSASGNLDVARMIPFSETADLTDVHFKFDQYDLDQHNKTILAKNAKWLAAHADVKIEIQGHCDERGTNNYNLGLGERRALSTKKYLMALGISQDRLFTISYGEERPFCTDSNENCWWQNRRGHFLVSK